MTIGITVEEQIKELNEEIKCTLAPSEIHGVGVFALRDIKQGEKAYCLPEGYKLYDISFERLSELRPEIEEMIKHKFPYLINADKSGVFESPNNSLLMSFMNHSDNANTEKDIALRDIKQGEELTEDYRKMPNYEKVFNFLNVPRL